MLSPFDAFALTVVALFVKMLGVALFQGVMRMRHNTFARPEDAECYGDGEAASAELPIVDRGQRTLRNDLENIPIFLFLAWCYVELNLWPGGALLYFGLFVATRYLHTATYLKPLQPYRTIAYAAGSLVMLALSGHIGYEVLVG
jgi:glutathione S-transferase